MMFAIILLTAAGLFATLYSRWQVKRNLANDEALKREQAKIDTLKVSIEATEKELRNAGKDYFSVYDSYNRKYNNSPRDNEPKQ